MVQELRVTQGAIETRYIMEDGALIGRIEVLNRETGNSSAVTFTYGANSVEVGFYVTGTSRAPFATVEIASYPGLKAAIELLRTQNVARVVGQGGSLNIRASAGSGPRP